MDQRAEIIWKGEGVPVAAAFDDPYFSLSDGLAESAHVFLAGNGLPERLCPGFEVAELGFGTGLNLLALAAVVPEDCPVVFTSFEAFPMAGAAAARALRAVAPVSEWMDRIEAVAELLEARAEAARIGPVEVRLLWGDARERLPGWAGAADAWFLDGFSPAKNPEMWGAALLDEVARHTKPGGTFATFTAAGAVRRALAAAGFDVERVPGFGSKRHMTRGVLR